MTLEHFGIADAKLDEDLAEGYVMESPRKTHLFPHTHETLSHLKSKYRVGLITNGFSEVQQIKIRQSNLEAYFDHVIISEQVGFKKPDPIIFQHAAGLCKAHVSACLMIGDNLDTDIKGALDAGMDALLFDPLSRHPTRPEYGNIQCLSELQTLL
jgi:putative hydrolase of the HAD superfamily